MKAAHKVSGQIKASVEQLKRFPMSGKVGRQPGTRELVIPGTSYIAVYTLRGDEVWIVMILHGRQDWPK